MVRRSIVLLFASGVLCLSSRPFGSSAQAQVHYSWTISASSTDPYVNTTSPKGPVASYYLWFLCGDDLAETSGAQFSLTTGNSSVLIVGVITVPPWLNAGSANCLLLATPCQTGPGVAARIVVVNFDMLPFSLCFEPCLGSLGTVDCLPKGIHPMNWIGLDVGVGACGVGELCTPLPFGACCLGNGECIHVNEAICEYQNGKYKGDHTTCAQSECAPFPGACCFPDSTCSELTQTECQQLGGLFQGFLTDCENVSCKPSPGACCIGGGCVIANAFDCAALGGQFAGGGIPCEGVDCGFTGQEPFSWGRIKASYR